SPKALVEEQGGTIEVVTSREGGTTFEIRLGETECPSRRSLRHPDRTAEVPRPVLRFDSGAFPRIRISMNPGSGRPKSTGGSANSGRRWIAVTHAHWGRCRDAALSAPRRAEGLREGRYPRTNHSH